MDRQRETGRWPWISSQIRSEQSTPEGAWRPTRGTKKLQRAKAVCGVWSLLICLPQETRGKFRKLKIRLSTMCMLISWRGTGLGDRVMLLVGWRLKLPRCQNAGVQQDSTHILLRSAKDKLEMPAEWEVWANCLLGPAELVYKSFLMTAKHPLWLLAPHAETSHFTPMRSHCSSDTSRLYRNE